MRKWLQSYTCVRFWYSTVLSPSVCEMLLLSLLARSLTEVYALAYKFDLPLPTVEFMQRCASPPGGFKGNGTGACSSNSVLSPPPTDPPKAKAGGIHPTSGAGATTKPLRVPATVAWLGPLLPSNDHDGPIEGEELCDPMDSGVSDNDENVFKGHSNDSSAAALAAQAVPEFKGPNASGVVALATPPASNMAVPDGPGSPQLLHEADPCPGRWRACRAGARRQVDV